MFYSKPTISRPEHRMKDNGSMLPQAMSDDLQNSEEFTAIITSSSPRPFRPTSAPPSEQKGVLPDQIPERATTPCEHSLLYPRFSLGWKRFLTVSTIFPNQYTFKNFRTVSLPRQRQTQLLLHHFIRVQRRPNIPINLKTLIISLKHPRTEECCQQRNTVDQLHF